MKAPAVVLSEAKDPIFLEQGILRFPLRTSSQSAGGFTLIELLVALTIFSAMAVSLGAAFHNGLGAWNAGRRSADLDQQARAALQQMSRELRNAVPVPGKTFTAEKGGISFFTVRDFQSQDALPEQEIVRVSYRIDPVGRFLEHVQSSPDQDLDEGKKTVLTTFPAEADFDFAFAPEKAGVRWEKEWISTDRLPAGVRVRLTLREGDGPSNVITFTKTIAVPTGVVTAWKE